MTHEILSESKIKRCASSIKFCFWDVSNDLITKRNNNTMSTFSLPNTSSSRCVSHFTNYIRLKRYLFNIRLRIGSNYIHPVANFLRSILKLNVIRNINIWKWIIKSHWLVCSRTAGKWLNQKMNDSFFIPQSYNNLYIRHEFLPGIWVPRIQAERKWAFWWKNWCPF